MWYLIKTIQYLLTHTILSRKVKVQNTWKRLLIKLKLNKKKFGLTANYEKPKTMKLVRYKTTHTATLKISNDMSAIVNDFKYLGTTVNGNNNISNKIWHWILFSNKCYFSLINVLKSKNIYRATRHKLYKPITRPVVMYSDGTRVVSWKK